MYNSIHVNGTPMPKREIEALLKLPKLFINGITWHRTGGGENAVAEYEGLIYGEKVFLHLMSLEMSNYWIVTWPDAHLKQGNGIRLVEYDLGSITNNAKRSIGNR